MQEKYLSIGYGYGKKGQVYSRLAKIVQYTDKNTNKECAFIDLKQTKFAEEIISIGEIKYIETTIL